MMFGPIHICTTPVLVSGIHAKMVPQGEVWVFESDPLRAWLHHIDYARLFGADQ